MRHVLAALAQRRQGDLEDVEAEEEVLAEALVLDLRLEVAVGGAEHAHVDLDLHLAAEPAQPALLEHAEQLGLQLDGDLAHLVEEERAAVGELEHAGAPLIRAGERAALVAEDLGLHQRGRDGGAVDGDERLLAPRGEVVDGARHHLLAGAATRR